MPTPSEQLLSRTIYDIDGTTTVWDFSFAGGYLDASHVNAYTELPNGARTPITVTPEMLIGEYQLQITPALPANAGVLVIYRNTPVSTPLVDFTEGPLTETALDTNAKQAVFVAAEAQDAVTTSNFQAAINAANSASAGAESAAQDAASALSAAAAAELSKTTATEAALSATGSATSANLSANSATLSEAAASDFAAAAASSAADAENVREDLAGTGGAALVGYGSLTAQVVLDAVKPGYPALWGALGEPANDTAAIAALVATQIADTQARTFKTTHGGFDVYFQQYRSGLKTASGVSGRYAPYPERLRYIGKGVHAPGALGATASTNFSWLHALYACYTAGNAEPVHATANNFGCGPLAGTVMDLTAYGGTVFASEVVVRHGQISPQSEITAISGGVVTVASVPGTSLHVYFGSGTSNRSGSYRGRALLNESKKLSVTATLNQSTRVVTLSAGATAIVGDYFGFVADTFTAAVGSPCRYVSRIKSITSPTEFVLDDTGESEGAVGDNVYQGTSTTGAATIWPASLPSGYNPELRQFSFDGAGAILDTRFVIGDTVVQHPSTSTVLIGHQVDLNRRAVQRVPKDFGFVSANDGRTAKAAYYATGSTVDTGPVSYENGALFRNVRTGLNLEIFPIGASVAAQGMSIVQRDVAPVTLGFSGAKGDLYLRSGGSVSKSAYVHTGAGFQPVATLAETTTSAASMPTVDVPGWRVFVTQFDYSVEWSTSNNRWQFMGLRAIGLAAAKPTSAKPPGFKYYETDTALTKTWDGLMWV